jgi:predicted 2-oxoglutarate/Fe(II)-dependent dioxygenase YbiX
MAILLHDYRQPGALPTSIEILYEEQFLDADACNRLMAYLIGREDRLERVDTEDKFFDNRFLWFTSLPDSERTCKAIMQAARRRIIEKLKTFYCESGPLYSDTIQLVRWMPGQAMPLHIDNAHPDGRAHRTPHREYASVVYLNDNFEGGELYFDRLKLMVPPKTGALVAFRGDASHRHGVTEVQRGVRYTMPAWYTRDVTQRDLSELEDFEQHG